MKIILIVILAVLCLVLLLRAYTVERALRRAARQLREREQEGSSARLLLAAPNSSAEALLAAVNGLFRFLGWEDCRARFLKIQRRMYQDPARELARSDYDRLITAARELGRNRLALLMETICATGIRVSEVPYITVEAARKGRT